MLLGNVGTYCCRWGEVAWSGALWVTLVDRVLTDFQDRVDIVVYSLICSFIFIPFYSHIMIRNLNGFFSSNWFDKLDHFLFFKNFIKLVWSNKSVTNFAVYITKFICFNKFDQVALQKHKINMLRKWSWNWHTHWYWNKHEAKLLTIFAKCLNLRRLTGFWIRLS